MIYLRYSFLLIMLISISACSDQINNVDYVIINTSVVDAANDTTYHNKLVAISGNTILHVDEAENLPKYKADSLINGVGRFVMPGLWDNHVHFRGGDTLSEANIKFLPLLIAHGITTVRDAGGDITPQLLEWRNQIEAGELVGPRIFTSGPKLDGTRPAWPGSITVQNAEDASAALDSLEKLGTDFVKIYDGNLTKEAFYEIIRQCEERGLQVTGHMPMSADFLEAVKLGLDGTEHLYYVLKAGSPLADSLTDAGLGYGMINSLIDSHDTTLANEVYDLLAEHEHFITPTLKVGKTLAEVLITDHSRDTMLAYIDDKIEATYAGRVNSAKRGGEQYTRNRAKMITQFRSMVKPIYKAGVPVLAGSDSGPYNSFVYPGISLHEELWLMVEAGLTPAEALTTSVINGPMFFGLENQYGSVEEGKTADLLILERNPLDDITNTTSVYALLLQGKLYDQTQLDSLMQSIKSS